MHDRTKGLIAVNIAAVIFGSAALFGKLDVSPIWIVAARGTFAALALFAIGALRRTLQKVERQHYQTLFRTGIVVGVHWITFFAAVQWAGVAIATLTFATFPLFTILFESVAQRRAPKLIEIAAGLTIIFAVFLLVDIRDENQLRLYGAAMGVASAVTFAWFGVESKKLGRGMSPLMVSAVQNSVVALALAPFLPYMAGAPDTGFEWGSLILLGVVTTAIMHQLYFYALQRLSAGTCSGFVALEPVYAILFAWAFFNEPLTLTVAISGVLIIGASFALLHVDKVKPEHVVLGPPA